MNIKDRAINIAKYAGLTIVGGLAMFNITKAQSTEYKKPLTEIRQEGDNIIIPSEKYNEFIKNYKPKNQTLNKTTDITLDGYITDALNTNPIEGIKIITQVYDGATLTGTYGPVNTDFTGYYQISGITDVEDEQTANNQAIVQYKGNKIFTNNFNEKTLKIYSEIGEEIKSIKTNNPDVEINLQGIATGRYITILEMDKKAYANMIIADAGIIIAQKKLEDKITEKNTNKLEKINTLGLVMDITDTTNNYHRYFSGAGEFDTNNPRRDFTLIPKINLETTITDPEYTIIPTIETIRDLIWYTARVQGEWQNQRFSGAAWPIKLYIDSTKAPNNGVVEARNVIQYFQDSLGIHPDSLIQESQTEIPPSATNGISAAKIIWTDSTVLGTLNSQLELIFSGNAEKFIGANIYIDTNKVHGEDIGKYIAVQLQKYSGPGGPNPINNTNYLGYTTNLRIGQRTRPNNDEKKFIKIGRNSKPYYLNKTFP
jgi:hypothetical protein